MLGASQTITMRMFHLIWRSSRCLPGAILSLFNSAPPYSLVAWSHVHGLSLRRMQIRRTEIQDSRPQNTIGLHITRVRAYRIKSLTRGTPKIRGCSTVFPRVGVSWICSRCVSDKLSWHCRYCGSGHETRASQALEVNAYSTFWRNSSLDPQNSILTTRLTLRVERNKEEELGYSKWRKIKSSLTLKSGMIRHCSMVGILPSRNTR